MQMYRLNLQKSIFRRSFSLSSFPFTQTQSDAVSFPSVTRGLDYDLNWSLAADSITTRGEAYRNASIRDLLEFAGSRKAVEVTKERALVVRTSAPAEAGAFATDAFAGRTVMDVEEFEGRLSSLRDECLSFAPRLFVEDAAVGSSRQSEVRVRVISDSSVVALFFRSLLQRTPLYAPEIFPRNITVLSATLASPEGVAAARGKSGPFTVVDVDPQTSKGTVIAVGDVPLASIASAVAAAAGQLMSLGGYRSIPGGSDNASINAARADGSLAWYMRDGHSYASKNEPHPDLLPLTTGTDVVKDGSGYSLIVGAPAGAVSGPAAAKGRLFAAHGCVWGSNEMSAFWSGLSVPSGSGLPLVRGALVAQGRTVLPVSSAGGRVVQHPNRVILVGGNSDASAAIKSACALSDKQAEKIAARISSSGAKVETVADASGALKALSLQ